MRSQGRGFPCIDDSSYITERKCLWMAVSHKCRSPLKVTRSMKEVSAMEDEKIYLLPK